MPKPKLNHPCPCGSGRKFKKCCFLGINDEDSCRQEECTGCTSSHCYRFRVGDRVEASIRGGFRPGTIVALNYREPGWLGDVPYQISLDGVASQLVFAPFDDDSWVRALSTPKVRQRSRISNY
mmetsp:Transcript_15625/g.23671  ORF Transcript_15625/g.23671 Transcript_15625/m.23671 type:complete len:123 (+) Transcript_15625:78-446(+)